MKKSILTQTLEEEEDIYMPGISVDCVIIGFHEGCLKILLCRFDSQNKWMLPGGFIKKDEDVNAAASRVLERRTGLNNIFLQQFYLFGNTDRIKMDENENLIQGLNIKEYKKKWFVNRFVSLGYYALVDYTKITVKSDDEDIAWFKLDEIPNLYGDHNKITENALGTIRKQIGYIPIGFELLPEKFTMPEIRSIYEAVLGEKQDRRNFQRKMLSTGVFIALDETKKIGAHKSPKLYKFDNKKYVYALKHGFNIDE